MFYAARMLPPLKWFAPLVVLIAPSLAAIPGAPPEGYWLTEKKDGVVEVVRCAGGGDTLCGRLVWFRIRPDDPNPQALDLKNPDPARRGRSLCGLIFMHGFRPSGPDEWEDGAIYDPDSGNTYHATMRLQADGSLRLRGYIGISLLGRSEVWTRYTQSPPACPSR
jgi:uncharacterized protein (DUF2147 family)